jgi:hypothetical protein
VLAGLRWTRKERFTLAISLSVGLGNILVPDFLTHLFDTVESNSDGLKGFLDSIEVILSTPYLCAFLIGVIMWNILPDEEDPGMIRQDEVAQTSLELGNVGPVVDTSLPYKGGSEDIEGSESKGSYGSATMTRVQEAT